MELINASIEGREEAVCVDGLRWLLRHQSVHGENRILFIGMNPGKAVRFEKETSFGHGDGTTRRILKFLDYLRVDNNPYDDYIDGGASEVILVNLIPIVTGQSQKVSELWDRIGSADQEWILASTMDLIVEFGNKADFIIPMWGNYRGKKNSWKLEPAQRVINHIAKLQDAAAILAVKNKDGSPRHIKPLGISSQQPWGGMLLAPFFS